MQSNGRLPKIDGTKKLVHKNQLLISLGIPALDLIIGGGLPTGNIILIEEDEFGVFSKIVLKHYLAEGLMNQHPLLLGSLDVDCDRLIFDLPSPMNVPFVSSLLNDDDYVKQRGELRIAWRYGNSAPANQTTERNAGPIFGHTFDLGPRGPIRNLVSTNEINVWVDFRKCDDCKSYALSIDTIVLGREHTRGRGNPRLHHSALVYQIKPGEAFILSSSFDERGKTRQPRIASAFSVSPALHTELYGIVIDLLLAADLYNYDTLYEYIAKMLKNPKYNCNVPSENRTVLRIALVSLATGMWTGNLIAFLIKLRLLLRNFCATCFITIQPKLLEHVKHLSRIEHFCDTVIELKSLLNEGNPTYEDYDGLVILKKLPSVNSWAPIVPETSDWAFKLRKNRFIVETLHISPELKIHDNPENEKDDSRQMALCISEQF